MNIIKGIKDIYSKFKIVQRRGREVKVQPLTEYEEVHCLNCGTTFQGKYCPTCGQTANVKRFTTRKMFHNLFVALIGGDNTFFNTLTSLLYRPGHMMRDYLCGKRVRYYYPIRMLLCLVAIFTIVSFVFGEGYDSFQLAESMDMSDVKSESLKRAMKFVSRMLSNNVIYGVVASFTYVFPFKLMFKNHKLLRPNGECKSLNTAEYFYTLVYISCQTMVLSLLIFPFSGMSGAENIIAKLSIIFNIFLPTWCYKQMFEINWFKSLLLSFIAIILTIIGIIVMTIIFFGVFYGYDAIAK